MEQLILLRGGPCDDRRRTIEHPILGYQEAVVGIPATVYIRVAKGYRIRDEDTLENIRAWHVAR